ncbi:hypothetical protein HOB25_02130 [bacterium]|jgi:hypothetical protein|nr:hypothetical protein [bacterium]MBT7037521.1 hypothetical protein [bacterium]
MKKMQKGKKLKKIFKKGALKITGVALIVLATVAVIGFERYNKNIGIDIKAASDGCPSSDWVPIGDFCIMDDLLSGGAEKWGESVYSCLDEEDARLCTVGEWMEACRLNEGNIISLDHMEVDGTDDYEWTGDIENAGTKKAITIGKNGCGDIKNEKILNEDRDRRCCINRARI